MVTPMLEAVPPTMAMAASTSPLQLRSGSLISAISLSCAMVMVPTFSLEGFPLPVLIPAAFLISTEAGGVFRMKVKDLSSYTVISTGMTVPALSCVFALYSLQKAMMFTPLAPRAGPMGGAGDAFPASMASLMNPATLAAMVVVLLREE